MKHPCDDCPARGNVCPDAYDQAAPFPDCLQLFENLNKIIKPIVLCTSSGSCSEQIERPRIVLCGQDHDAYCKNKKGVIK